MKAPPTFLTASKHLFRHLCDADALRKNPLVARFFGDRAPGLNRVQDDREALARIHRLVGEGARSCREADLAAGRHERARRHYTIAILQLLERRTIHEVAARLGISSQQCYRERADVSRRIAHYISLQLERAVQYLPNLDAFGLLMETTRRGAAYREAGAALRQCDDLVSAAPSPERKV